MLLSQPCHLAGHTGIAMTLDGKQKLHAGCPGLCVHVDRTVECECDCHSEQGSKLAKAVTAKASGARLPVAVEVSAPTAPPARKDRTGAVPAPNGRCQCGCGRTTGGRFAPGHDAQLKSALWKGAREGSFKDWAELVLRDWAKAFDVKRLPFEVETKGEAFAESMPDLVVRRTEYRQAQ